MKKIAKISAWGTVGGICLAFAGLMLSGFGPCGPQHPGPFLAAVLGAFSSLAGGLSLLICSMVLGFRRLHSFSSRISGAKKDLST
jgi:hypothetical protein